ncbi:carbon-nitrogen hydrolase [Candidatus Micrarchaeota archaeon]|nr:carbon-nitrogen hydrolase [Candidatus Micrarchaeota archaeon]
MPNLVKIGLIQACASGDAGQNLEKTLSLIAQAAQKGAQIICLQELFLTKYFAQYEDKKNFSLAESIPGPTSNALCESAKKNKVNLIGSVFEKTKEGKYFNTAVVIDSRGKLAGTYRKMHVPYDPRFYEKYYFTPGDSGFKSFDLGSAKIAPLICYDQWFPEAARLVSLAGAQIIFYPTAIGWGGADRLDKTIQKAQLEAWLTIQKSHAIANGVFVAAVNRVGVEDDIEFWGNSFVCSPDGQVIAQASKDKEEVLIAQCDLDLIKEQREGWPFFRDRRSDAYSGIEKQSRG